MDESTATMEPPAETTEPAAAEPATAETSTVNRENDDSRQDVNSAVAGLKGLTVCQPYAHLLCLPIEDPEHKLTENRDWPTDYRGPLAIHAGKSREWLSPGDETRWPDMPFGAIEGVGDLIDCLRAEDIRAGKYEEKYPGLKDHKHVEGPWCWLTVRVRALPTPIPCSGAQRLWNVPADIAEQVRAALAEPPAAPTPDTGSATTETPIDAARKIADLPLDPFFVPSPDVWEAIEEARQDEKNAEAEVDELTESLRAAKKELETASKRLGQLIDEAHTPTLFGQKKRGQSANVAAEPSTASGESAQNIPENIPAVDPNAWRSRPISDLTTLPASVRERLEAAGIKMVGPAADFLASECKQPKVSRFGEVSQKALEDAFAQFWVDNPVEKPATEAVEQVQPSATDAAEVQPVLKWKPLDMNSPGEEFAENTAGIRNEDKVLCAFYVRPGDAASGEGAFIADGSIELGFTADNHDFKTLDAAKAWCEQRNAELVKAAAPQDDKPIDGVDLGTSILGANGKIGKTKWRVALAVHKREDGTFAHAWDVKLADVTSESPIGGSFQSKEGAAVAGIADIRKFLSDNKSKLDAAGLKAMKAVEKQLDAAEKVQQS